MNDRWVAYREQGQTKDYNVLLPEDDILNRWQIIAENDKSHVLIAGDTGSGKDELAKLLWYHSPRRDKPFERTDCKSTPNDLFGDKLFGHVEGGYTDATAYRKGLLETNEGGTVDLQEIGELTTETQASLLQYIETGEYTKIGEDKTRHVDTRIIATTNIDITNKDIFRTDLYARFPNVIFLPPLRNRRQDIPFLIAEFMKSGEYYTGIDPIWLFELMSYEWPGNIRELYQYCDSTKRMARYHADAKTNVQPDQDNINRVLSKDSKSDIRIKEAKHFHKAPFYDRLPPTEDEIAARKDAKEQDPEHCGYLEIPTNSIRDEFNPRYDIQQHPKEWLADNDIHPAYIAEELLESYQRTYGKQKIIPPYISNMLYLLTGLRAPFKEEPIVKLGLPFQYLEHNPKCFDISIIHKSKTSVCVSLTDAMVALIDYREFQYQMLLEAEVSNLYDVDDVLSQIFDARVKPDFIKRIVETGHSIPGCGAVKKAAPIIQDHPKKEHKKKGQPEHISPESLFDALNNAESMGIKTWEKLKPRIQKVKKDGSFIPAHKTWGALDRRIRRISNKNPELYAARAEHCSAYLKTVSP